MSLADKLVSSFLAFELDIDIQSPIHAKRTNALKEFEKLGFPTKKDEAWKYTSLKSVIKEDFTIFSKKKNVLDFKNVKNYFLDKNIKPKLFKSNLKITKAQVILPFQNRSFPQHRTP